MDNAKKVLIVEDETLTAMAIEAYIEERGHMVVGLSASGEDAVRKAREEEPDLILMDFRLAGRMDGIQAALLIEAERPTPIAIISGYAERTVLEGTEGYKPIAYLSKPIDFADIDGILALIE
jgi:two-component system, cell cycle sensor histidine kinase and response regulator CckA